MDKSTQEAAATTTGEVVNQATMGEESTRWQARAAYLQVQAQREEEAKIAEKQRALTLEAQLRDLEAYAADLETRLAQTQAHLDAAQSRGQLRPITTAARPPIVDLVDQLPRSPDPTNLYPRRQLSQIRSLVIHRSGSGPEMSPQQMAELHINDPKRQWPGIGFHFFIAADGAIFQTNRLDSACFHVAQHNATSAGIVLAGEMGAGAPAERQMASVAALLAWLLGELRLPVESVAGHCDFPGQETVCPGAGWQGAGGWKETLLEKVRQAGQAPQRSMYHYVLFWQTDKGWAEDDWEAATRYVGRFRPAAGFSAAEAKQAEHVTIVGGPAGVPADIEEMLRAAGCSVQRVAGKTSRQTRALLDAMANEGRRFLSS
jgi:hypothetical protein